MADMAIEISKYIADNALGTEGTDLFIGTMPDTTNNTVAVKATGGFAPTAEFETLHKQPTIQVMVRNATYPAGFTKAESIHELLIADHNAILISGGTYVYTIKAQAEIGYLGKDEDDRHLFSTNYTLRTVR